jgi:hypothetical protein
LAILAVTMVSNLLVDKSMLIKDKLVENACKVNALEHQNVSDNLTGHECVLHFFIWDEVIKPVLAEFGDTTHLEEVS